MAEFSNYLENAFINAALRATNFTAPTTVYVSLYTSDPTDADTGTEVSGGSYARTSAAFDAPSNGVTQNTSDVTFPTATASWGTVTHVAIHDAASAGNMLFHTPLDTSKTIDSGDIFKITAGNLTVTLA